MDGSDSGPCAGRWSSRIVDLYDGIALVGLILLGVGLWLIWPPLGLVVPGALLLGLGVVLGLMRGRQGGSNGDHSASG